MIRFAITIFLSAFLLFAVQPLMGKYILPWYGGGAGVWAACMLFFQCALLVGYLYAHLLSSRLTRSRQATVHFAVLAVSLLLLPIAPELSWKPSSPHAPTGQILSLLVINVGIPFTLLASTGPLLSRWFSIALPTGSPYRLYALSNAGSLLALLSYPFLVEPFLRLTVQAWIWSVAYTVFVLMCAGCAWQFRRAADQSVASMAEGAIHSEQRGAAPDDHPSRHTMSLWLILAATASVMLLATTHQVSQDLAVIPLLWVLPLALYLLSFILCFDHHWWYKRWLFMPLLAAGAVAVVFIMFDELVLSAWIQIGVYLVTLFACCMVCHGELVRLKPAATHLTRFYLIVATGGAAGGVSVALVAPAVLPNYWEYHLGLTATIVLAMLCVYRDSRTRRRREREIVSERAHARSQPRNKAGKRRKDKGRVPSPPLGKWSPLPWLPWLAWGGSFAILVGVSVGLILDARHDLQRVVDSSRNFFGVVQVLEGKTILAMVHGRSVHGVQSRRAGMRRTPTTYYGPDSGVAIAVDAIRYERRSGGNSVAGHQRGTDNGIGADDGNLRIGVIGLGAGTTAALAQSGDYLRYYEINPDVERLARKHFTFIEDTGAKVDVVLGDARVVLEHEAGTGQLQRLDVFVIDAFNSDAVPMHLLTREALEVYFSHLKPDGLLVFNVSNRYVNLAAVVRGLAQSTGRHAVRIYSTPHPQLNTLAASWVIVANDRTFAESDTVKVEETQWTENESLPILWTDDFASLWPAVLAYKGDAASKWEEAPNQGQFVVDRAGLLSNADQKRLLRLCRELYHDSAGARALMVVTTAATPSINGRSVPPPRYLAHLYRRLGFKTEEGETSALMILVSTKDDTAFVQIPKRWPQSLKKQIQDAIADIMFDGTAIDNFSGRLTSGVAGIGEMVRKAPKVRLSQAAD